jgi:hypothetical protein
LGLVAFRRRKAERKGTEKARHWPSRIFWPLPTRKVLLADQPAVLPVVAGIALLGDVSRSLFAFASKFNRTTIDPVISHSVKVYDADLTTALVTRGGEWRRHHEMKSDFQRRHLSSYACRITKSCPNKFRRNCDQ